MLNQLNRIPKWILIIISGLFTAAAFPPSPLGFLAYFSLIPLILVFVQDEFYLGFEKGFLFGVILSFGILYWLAFNKGTEWYWAFLSMTSGVLFLALNYGVIGILIGIIGRRLGKTAGIWSFPVIWVAIEFIRSFGTLGFTWSNLCYTQSNAIQLIQFASITGPHAVSFLIILINVLIYNIIFDPVSSKRKLTYITAILLLFLIPEIYGLSVLQKSNRMNDSRTVCVGLIQPNVDPNAKWNSKYFKNNMQLLHDLTDSVTIEALDLVVWPESATPTYLRRNRRHSLDKIIDHISTLDVSLVTGVPDYELTSSEEYKAYNAVFLLRPSSYNIESYRKIKLVPLGEYIPLSGVFPDLNNLNLGQGNFDAGEEVNVFQVPLKVIKLQSSDTTLFFTTVVCYESTFPYIVREGARKGSEMLIIVSNDAWFGFTSAPFLHAEISRFRAIENRIPVVRSANTGVSMIIDSYGRVLKRIGLGKLGWLSAEIQQGNPKTLYTKFGNWFGCLCVLISSGFLVICFFKRKKV